MVVLSLESMLTSSSLAFLRCHIFTSSAFMLVQYICELFFFFQAEDGIRDLVRSRGLGDVYKRQE